MNRKTGGGIRYEDFYGKDTDGERDDGGEDGEDDDDDEMEEDEMEEDEEDSGDEVQKDLFAEGKCERACHPGVGVVSEGVLWLG